MDNEADCGCVIRVGNPGRHRNNNDVRDDLHQDSENAGGDHMAYPTELTIESCAGGGLWDVEISAHLGKTNVA